MKANPTIEPPPPHPVWCAVGGVFAVPLLAVGLVIMAVAALATWPFVPVLLCMVRRRDIRCESDGEV